MDLNSESESFYSVKNSPTLKPQNSLRSDSFKQSNVPIPLDRHSSLSMGTIDGSLSPSLALASAINISKGLEEDIRKTQSETKSFEKNLQTYKEQRSRLENSLQTLTSDFETCKNITVKQLTSEHEDLKFDINRIKLKIKEESDRILDFEKSKQLLQFELNDLTLKLSQEANNMVNEEKKITKDWKHKFESLQNDFKNYEILLKKEKELVGELKAECESLDPTICFEPEKFYDNILNDFKLFNLPEPNSPNVGFSCILNLSDSLENDIISFNSDKPVSQDDYRFLEFKEFLEAPVDKGLYLSSKFMKRAHVEDIEPTLRFDYNMQNVRSIQKQLLAFVHSENCNMAPFKDSTSSTPLSCFFCTNIIEVGPYFRIDFTEDISLNTLCFLCHKRISSVCDFFSFLRTSRDKKDVSQKIYTECLLAKQKMFLARSGLEYSNSQCSLKKTSVV